MLNLFAVQPKQYYLQKLLKFWPVVLFAFLSVLGSWFCLLFITPLYQTDAKIQLQVENKIAADSAASGSLYQPGATNADNEINIIQSKKLLTDVVQNLGLYATVFIDGRLRNYVQYQNSPVFIKADSVSGYVPVSRVAFNLTGSAIVINKKSYPLNTWVFTPYGKLKFIKNPHFTAGNKQERFCFSLTNVNSVVNAIAANLSVYTAEGVSEIVYISLKDAVRQRGKDIVNNLVSLYNRSKMIEKTANNGDKFQYIDKRLAVIKSKLLVLEKQQEDYRSQKEAALVRHENRFAREYQLDLIDNRMAKVSHQYNTESQIYTYLLQKKEDSAIADFDNTPQSKIIDPAESTDVPVSPKTHIIYLTAFLLGLLGSIGIFSLKRLTVSKITPLPKVGARVTELPKANDLQIEKGADTLLIDASTMTVMSEQFKKLRNTLNYLGIKNEQKRIMVTSAVLGEGKSFIATNLALSLALAGKRVVLLDFNLHHPALARKLKIKQEAGISDYLSHKAELNQMISQTAINNNLFFIPAGNVTDNPSELIKSELLTEMLNRLSTEFSYIIMDTAPVGYISDAYILSAHCDVTLYTVRHAFTSETFTERFDEKNNLNKLKNVTMVFNEATQQAHNNQEDSGYHYNYGDN